MDEARRFSNPFLQGVWNELARINHYLLTASRQWSPVELGIAPRNMARDLDQAEINRLNARAQLKLDIENAERISTLPATK
jgi:hypothetical protein